MTPQDGCGVDQKCLLPNRESRFWSTLVGHECVRSLLENIQAKQQFLLNAISSARRDGVRGCCSFIPRPFMPTASSEW